MAENVFQKQLKILVTGGTGFLGRNLLSVLAGRNWFTMVLVRPGREPDLPSGNFQLIRGTLDDVPSLSEACGGCGVVVHLAAAVEARSGREYQKVNVLGTKNLIEACRLAASEQLIFISSANVVSGKSRYAASKREAEQLVVGSGLNYTIIRPTLLYGPGEVRNIGFLMNFARKYKIIPVFGGGEYKLQPLYVGDLTQAIAVCIGNPRSFNKIYNLGGPDILTYNRMLEIIKKTFALRFRTLRLPATPFSLLEKAGLMPWKIRDKFVDLTADKTADNNFLQDFELDLTSFEDGLKKSYEKIYE